MSKDLIHVLFVILFLLPAYARNQDQDRTLLNDYYNLLESMTPDSTLNKIDKLKKFISSHPSFDKCYQRLTDEFIISDQMEIGQAYFRTLGEDDQYKSLSLWMLGRLYLKEEKYDTALTIFESSLQPLSNSPLFIYEYVKCVHEQFHKFKKHEKYKIASLPESVLPVAEAYWNYIEYKSSKAIALFENLDTDFASDLDVLYRLGVSYKRIGDDERAEFCWRKGLNLAKINMDLEYEAKFYLALGTLIKYFQTKIGLAFYDSSLVISKRIGDLKNLEFLLGNKAVISRREGDQHTAEKLFLEVIDISTRLKSIKNLCRWYFQYGLLLDYMEQYDEALRAYELGEKYAAQANNLKTLMQIQYYRGELYELMGQYNLALESFQSVLKRAREFDMAETIRRAKLGMAKVYYKRNQIPEARKIYENYLKEDYLDDKAYCLTRLGVIESDQKKYARAEALFREANQVATQMELGYMKIWSLLYLSDVYLKTNRQQLAEKNYKTCLEVAEAYKDSSSLPSIYMGLADVYKSRKEYNQAIIKYHKALSILDELRKNLSIEEFRIEYFQKSSEIYDHLTECYYILYTNSKNISYIDSLYVSLDMNRGRSFHEINNPEPHTLDSYTETDQYNKYRQIESHLIQKQRHFREQIYSIDDKSRIEALFAEIQLNQQSLLAQRFKMQAGIGEQQKIQPTEIYSLLSAKDYTRSDDLGILMYEISDSISFVISIIEGNAAVVPLNLPRNELLSDIQKLLNPFYSIDENNFRETEFRADIANKLYRILFEPLENIFKLPSNLIIIPDYELTNLPFDILLSKKPLKSSFTPKESPVYANNFLVQKYSFSYSPNLRLIKEKPNSYFGKPEIAIFTNPFSPNSIPGANRQNSNDSDIKIKDSAGNKLPDQKVDIKLSNLRSGWYFNPLPFSEVEAIKIQKIAPQSMIYKHADAKESSFKKNSPEYDIIHIATHAFIDTVDDYFSGLVFSPAEDTLSDGLLMGYEIHDLPLNTDLIILSACETARGKVLIGEGVLGLPRLFLAAGANSVLMTLWRIDDYFTSELIPEFLKIYLENNCTKSAALSLAKRRIINSSTASGNGFYIQHPIFWATYAIYGGPGNGKKSMFYSELNILIFLFLLLIMVIFLRFKGSTIYKYLIRQVKK